MNLHGKPPRLPWLFYYPIHPDFLQNQGSISSFCPSPPTSVSRQSHPEHTRNAPLTPTGS